MYYIINLAQTSSKKYKYLSNPLIEKITQYIERNEKVILYLNRRGEYSSVICKDCHNIFMCPQCDVSLSSHKNPSKLICHICGYQEDIPITCTKCSGSALENIGVGTEQIEEKIKELFPSRKVFRFDFDSTKNQSLKKEALKSLEDAEIIIGTKMITSGFDFEKVGLIGVILVEQELSVPEYNIEEKVYQNMKQLFGRAGRKGHNAEIMLQTFVPNNPIIEMLTTKNFSDFLKMSLEERKIFRYPPWSEFVKIEYRDINSEKAHLFLKKIFLKLEIANAKGEYELFFSEIPRRKYNQYHYHIIIKGKKIRDLLSHIKNEIFRNKNLIVIF